jgi:hypothetical protein
LSLVDCAGFELMRDLGIVTALAFDRHFEDQGWVRGELKAAFPDMQAGDIEQARPAGIGTTLPTASPERVVLTFCGSTTGLESSAVCVDIGRCTRRRNGRESSLVHIGRSRRPVDAVCSHLCEPVVSWPRRLESGRPTRVHPEIANLDRRRLACRTRRA